MINFCFSFNFCSVSHVHSDIPFHSNGFWKKNWSWKGRWIKSWSARKVWVPTWKRVWGPIEIKEWVPLPPPHRPVHHLELPHVHLHSQW